MSVFDFLPIVEQCCCCINLKLGSILIALFGVLSFTNSAYLLLYPICGSGEAIIVTVVSILGYVLLAADIFMVIASIAFLIGIFTGNRMTAVIFLCAITCMILVYLVFIITVIVAVFIATGCAVNWEHLTLILTILLWIYFMIVIRSYKDEMF